MPDGSPHALREAPLPRLVQVVVQPDGATMSCYYCRHQAPIEIGDVAGQILQFQEAHFGCDPAVATTTIPPQSHLPRQTALE
jgi:hypothetical protein